MGSFGVVIIEFGNFTSGLIASSIFLPFLLYVRGRT